MNPIFLDLKIVMITWYAVFIFAGILLATIYIVYEANKFLIGEEESTNLVFWTVIFGIIGARIYYVLFNWNYYSNNLLDIIKTWEGGLAIHGGIIAGVLTIIFYAKKHSFSVKRLFDISVVGLILAQAIGRWGNFFNSEAHGPVVSLSFLESIHLPNFIIDGMFIEGSYYHPTFLYESLWCLLGFVVLLLLKKLPYLKRGQLTSVYLIWYGIGRFFIEGLRTDSLMMGSIKSAQIVSVIMVMLGVVLLIKFKGKSKFIDLYKDYDIPLEDETITTEVPNEPNPIITNNN